MNQDNRGRRTRPERLVALASFRRQFPNVRALWFRAIFCSVELLIQELRRQRDAQLRHFEALDARAGILLGFAGAIATFSPRGGGLGIAGRSFAVLAALLALASFTPQGFPLFRTSAITNVLDVRERAIQEQRLVERLTWTIERAGWVLRSKSRALALALTSIVAATALLGGGIIFSGGSP